MIELFNDLNASAGLREDGGQPDEAHPVPPVDCSAVITHHWLVRMRGGEQVLSALRELLPDSPLFTLVHDPRGAGVAWQTVHSSWLRYVPGARRHYPKLLPLMPLAARRMRLPDADLVVCSDAALAKAMQPAARSRVVCYCHSPMRYVWEQDVRRTYQARLPVAIRPAWPAVAAWLRRVDRVAARRVDVFVANSRHVAQRIERCYGRTAEVVYPPVNLPARPSARPRGDFYLCVGHHVPYKRLDLAVEACRQLRKKLVVIGNGAEVGRLRRAGGTEHVQWLGWQPDVAVRRYYAEARALLFPGEEDFGIVPVEAMAHGCPVVAYGVGGATETVQEGLTGLFFTQPTPEALAAAMSHCAKQQFDPHVMWNAMQRFSRPRFLEEMRGVLLRALEQPRSAPQRAE